jgi:hypothetical protein
VTTWAVWLAAAMIVFACIEGFALVTRRIPTLSRTTVRLCARYPLLAFLLGAIAGGLAVHFFGWTPDRWC